MKISLKKRISLYLEYKKTIKKIEKELESQFGIKVDRITRLYTVINIPSDIVEEPYNLRKNDIDIIADRYIREYSVLLSNFLNQNGLKELFEFYEGSKVGKYSYLLIFGYSLINTYKAAKLIYFRILPFLLLTIITTLIIFCH